MSNLILICKVYKYSNGCCFLVPKHNICQVFIADRESSMFVMVQMLRLLENEKMKAHLESCKMQCYLKLLHLLKRIFQGNNAHRVNGRHKNSKLRVTHCYRCFKFFDDSAWMYVLEMFSSAGQTWVILRSKYKLNLLSERVTQGGIVSPIQALISGAL